MKTDNVNKIYTVIGLMSGTSLDGVDVALIETDGEDQVTAKGFHYVPYASSLREQLRGCFGLTTPCDMTDAATYDLTLAHIDAVQAFMQQHHVQPSDIDLIGFHGQTISHDPANRFTWQLGDGEMLARQTGIDVIHDFRTNDVKAGGQGAPLIPAYHAALARSARLQAPVAILNIGGVSNVTWIGSEQQDILAFDCGPGNALIDDTVLKATGEKCDWGGKLAMSGTTNADIVARWLLHPFFDMKPPKSLDRGAWDVSTISNYPLADAVATLTDFTIQTIVRAAQHFPVPAQSWYVTGGGRHNNAIMNGLECLLGVPVKSVDMLGWNGDALEAEGFAYLAVRSLLGKPLSYPTTTGVPVPLTGGVFWPKAA